MPNDDKMPTEELLPYLRRMQKRYVAADRRGRSVLLDEMKAMTGLDRKTLIRWMNRPVERKPRSGERGREYGAGVEDALRVIAETLNEITVERLTPGLVDAAQILAAHGEIVLTPELEKQLGRISPSTVGRILRRLRQDEPRLPRRGPREANSLRRNVPMRRIPWDEREPGHFEADLVYHSGPDSAGEHVHTVQLVDVATGWSERRAVLGRSYLVMADAFLHITRRLPFPILELHPDNGSEFFNHHLLRFWGELIPDLRLSRSRPWQKNDNRFVEQKNDTLVRAFLGHARLDTVAQTRAVNALYEDMWAYYNFFQPVMRLKDKTVSHDAQGRTHTHRHYDVAATPFERLCASGVLGAEDQERWRAWRANINPRKLHQAIMDQLQALFRLPCARSGEVHDVYETLSATQHGKEEGHPVTFSND